MSAPPPPPAPTGTPSGQPPPPTGRRRITRRREGRLLAGVATGIAAHLEVDPVLVRVGFVVLAFVPFPGFGLLLYIALAFLLPTDDAGTTPGTPVDPVNGRGLGFYVGIGLVALAGLWLLGGGGLFVFDGVGRRGALFPLLLIGLGIALWVDADRRRVTRPAATPADAVAHAETGQAPTGSAVTGGPPWSGAGASSPAPTWAAPPPPPPSSPLGRITLGLALLAAGAVWFLDLLDVVRASGTTILAVALLVVGLGLLLGSVVGRARWLTVIAVPLAIVTLVSSTLLGFGVPLRHGVGQRVVVFDAADDVSAPIEQTGGQLVLDLRDLEPDEQHPTITARLGGGEIEVIVPDGAGLTGILRVEAGAIVVFGTESGGLGVSRTLNRAAEPGRPTFDLDLQVFAGEIVVRDDGHEWQSSIEPGVMEPFADWSDR